MTKTDINLLRAKRFFIKFMKQNEKILMREYNSLSHANGVATRHWNSASRLLTSVGFTDKEVLDFYKKVVDEYCTATSIIGGK